MSKKLNTAGACVIGAVNTKTGFTAVTFCGNACTNKRNGPKDFDRGIIHSASANCYNEKGKTIWAKAMEMAKNVCNYMNGKQLPKGATVHRK